jgi:hypothetical protein
MPECRPAHLRVGDTDEKTIRLTRRAIWRIFAALLECGSFNRATPRSPDLVHLRTALWFDEQSKLSRFVSLDEEQNLSAAEPGLPV